MTKGSESTTMLTFSRLYNISGKVLPKNYYIPLVVFSSLHSSSKSTAVKHWQLFTLCHTHQWPGGT